MAWVSLPSLNVRYPTESMMPGGKVRSIPRNASQRNNVHDGRNAGLDYKLAEASTFQRG
jgi:hypothetical protein